jgi:hypothetical protein
MEHRIASAAKEQASTLARKVAHMTKSITESLDANTRRLTTIEASLARQAATIPANLATGLAEPGMAPTFPSRSASSASATTTHKRDQAKALRDQHAANHVLPYLGKEGGFDFWHGPMQFAHNLMSTPKPVGDQLAYVSRISKQLANILEQDQTWDQSIWKPINIPDWALTIANRLYILAVKRQEFNLDSNRVAFSVTNAANKAVSEEMSVGLSE